MNQVRKAAVAAALALFVSPSFAQSALGGPDSAWYVGASVGQSKSPDFCGLAFGFGTCDGTDTAYGIFAGYKVNKNLAMEFGYHQLGDVSLNAPGTTLTFKTETYDLVALGMLPVADRLALYGKLGIYYGKVKGSTNIPGSGISGAGNDLTYGVGGQYDITDTLGIRLEWQKYNNVPVASFIGIPLSIGYEVTNLAAIWRFK
jgi:OOP family OmpA-OmpF porin